MKKPKMILFDYGETLCTEFWGDPLGGCRAVLAAASANPKGVTEEQLLAQFQAIDRDLTRLPSDPWQTGPELRWQSFARYVFESLALEFPPELDYQSLEELFWYSRTEPTRAVEYVPELLRFLQQEGVRTAVVSNLCYTELTLRKRLDKCLPGHRLEFVMVSSEYAFRKPHPRLFQLALQKAGLPAGEVWFCGDNAACDVDGPAALGMQTVWFTGSMHNPESRQLQPKSQGWLEVRHWQELEALLRQAE